MGYTPPPSAMQSNRQLHMSMSSPGVIAEPYRYSWIRLWGLWLRSRLCSPALQVAFAREQVCGRALLGFCHQVMLLGSVMLRAPAESAAAGSCPCCQHALRCPVRTLHSAGALPRLGGLCQGSSSMRPHQLRS